MIKKIIFIVAAAVLFIVPVVSANDGGSRPDTQRLSFSFTLKSKEVQIGEPFEFAVKIVNNTSREAEMIAFDQIFDDSYETRNVNIKEIIIPAYKTVTLDISYIVPNSINWHEKNGKYYTDFSPDMYYWAKELLDGEEKGEMYQEWDDYWDYYQLNDTLIPLEITNLNDGSEYAKLSLLDDKNIIGFYDGAYHESASWNGELICKNPSYLKLENLTDTSFHDVSVYQRYYGKGLKINHEILDANDNFTFKHIYYDKLMEDDIPPKINVNYRVIFSLDNQYYCTNTSREYGTRAYDIPDVVMHEYREYNKETKSYTYKYAVENISDATYDNFIVLYYNNVNVKDSYEKYADSIRYGEFKAGDIWEIPLLFYHTGQLCFLMGILESDTLYYNSFSKSFMYDLEDYVSYPEGVEENILDLGYQNYNVYVLDVYYALNDIEVNYPKESSENEHGEFKPTPLILKPTPLPTNSPTATATLELSEILMNIEAKQVPYIPVWSWVAVLTAAVVSSALIYYIKKMDKKDKSDD